MAAALYNQSQPPGRRNWEADGRWVEIPSNFRWRRDEEDRVEGLAGLALRSHPQMDPWLPHHLRG